MIAIINSRGIMAVTADKFIKGKRLVHEDFVQLSTFIFEKAVEQNWS